jgi:hypothetical protein
MSARWIASGDITELLYSEIGRRLPHLGEEFRSGLALGILLAMPRTWFKVNADPKLSIRISDELLAMFERAQAGRLC